jgi:hypothetical protein
MNNTTRTCRFPASGSPTGFTARHTTGQLMAGVRDADVKAAVLVGGGFAAAVAMMPNHQDIQTVSTASAKYDMNEWTWNPVSNVYERKTASIPAADAPVTVPAPSLPPPPLVADNDAFIQMDAAIGCDSHYSDEKKEAIYRKDYKGKTMVLRGTVADVDHGRIGLKLLPHTLVYDIAVDLANSHDSFDIEKGQTITLKFQVSYQGGCFLSYSGKNGVIVN